VIVICNKRLLTYLLTYTHSFTGLRAPVFIAFNPSRNRTTTVD